MGGLVSQGCMDPCKVLVKMQTFWGNGESERGLKFWKARLVSREKDEYEAS
jgi:hypothetical protein